MCKLFLFLLIISSGSAAFPQLQLGVFGGLSDFNGDLLDKPYRLSHGAFGITAGYELSGHFTVRAGVTFGKLAGADSLSNKYFKRNLSFQSKLTELCLTGEYSWYDLQERRLSPFVFTGLAVYHFNPYTYDQNHQKYYLRPLSTEGQGLSQYPDRKPYTLTQLAVPLGGGLKYAFNDNIQMAVQVGLRILFTDYLDDVSTTYVDAADLLAARGAKAVELAYRSDELPTGNPVFPKKGAHRGGTRYNDWYYFSGLHVSFRLGGENRRSNLGGSHRRGYGCTRVPY